MRNATFTVRRTILGPVVTDSDHDAIGLFEPDDVEVAAYNLPLALRWAAIDPAINDTTLDSLLDLNRVRLVVGVLILVNFPN